MAYRKVSAGKGGISGAVGGIRKGTKAGRGKLGGLTTPFSNAITKKPFSSGRGTTGRGR